MISKIRVHPTNPDLVYVAAFGHHAAPNPERGVFRSKDGGKTWDKILFRDNKTGAIELILDPKQPAGHLRRAVGGVSERVGDVERRTRQRHLQDDRRRRSLDRDLAQPRPAEAMLGKIGLAVSGADSNRVYAQIEAEDGGFFLVRRRRRDVDEGQRAPRSAAARVLLHARLRRSRRRRTPSTC